MALAPILTRPNVRNVPSREPAGRTYLTEAEMEQLLQAAKQSRYGVRDYALLLVGYRHGLRVSELVGLRLDHLDLATAHLWVQRLKGSVSTQQPIQGDVLRALRRWLSLREKSRWAHLPWLFVSERGSMSRKAVNYLIAAAGQRGGLSRHVHPHMLRHSCGYALANKGYDTRLIQDYLGHKNIQHTVRYTQTAAKRFEGLWE